MKFPWYKRMYDLLSSSPVYDTAALTNSATPLDTNVLSLSKNSTCHDREESDDEEEEDIEDDEPNGDFGVASDEDLEGSEDDDDELLAGPGQEGILLWDSLGEGFLIEASQIGMSFWYYYFKF